MTWLTNTVQKNDAVPELLKLIQAQGDKVNWKYIVVQKKHLLVPEKLTFLREPANMSFSQIKQPGEKKLL